MTAVACLLPVAATVALVLAWPRLARGRAPHVALRVGSLLLVQVLALVAAGVLLNDAFAFFAGWGDLAGAAGLAPSAGAAARRQTVLDAGAADPAQRQRVLVPASAWSPPTAAALAGALPPGGRPVPGQPGVTSWTVPGAASGLAAPVDVLLPPRYAELAAHGHRFPVIEVFGGYPSARSQWMHAMRLRQDLAQLAAQRVLTPPVVVMPATEIPRGTDTECADLAAVGGAQVGTWVTRDVPAWVHRNLAVDPAAGGWATLGLSSGAYCALRSTVDAPGTFGAAISFAGYDRALFPSPPGWAQLPADDDVSGVVARTRPPVALWLMTSRSDAISYAPTLRLLAAARPPTTVHALVLASAGHRTAVWAPLVPGALTWLAAHEPAFAPGGTVPAAHSSIRASSTRSTVFRASSGQGATSPRR
ncbi:MAG: alpha/beta hydrolase [Motilibacteraceae bacterium]